MKSKAITDSKDRTVNIVQDSLETFEQVKFSSESKIQIVSDNFGR